MNILCPSCGSRRVRHASIRSLGEFIGSWFGNHPLRCRDCEHRFVHKVWRLSDIIYAQCPRCLRMELSTWDERHYRPSTSMLLKLRLGAKHVRCDVCRVNLASFRKVKASFRYYTKPDKPVDRSVA